MSQPLPPSMRVVDNLTTVPPPAPIQVGNNGSPGGYHFEPDQVQSVITKWQNLLQDLEQDRLDAHQIALIQAPAPDPASNQFTDNGALPSGRTLLEQTDRMIQYVQNYIEALQKASGQIQQADADAQQAVSQSGEGVM
ncbi:hypothetical protein [Amycolatopsis taiwanensis]|uniref:PE domain-containing protein n=1 Tax=Amycolatopsis taiwanensis TaxID=342230 RepID=A0A9W6R0T5_9PSEU|nr:hypothetical protein [Amycolatopsis taiwanensis]GLY67489.1 hypothetical protein Atai01_41080 [Amycolatopsis taiwanensis]